MKHPEPIVEVISGIHVVRDDFIQGGTKRRFIDDYIAGANANEFVYASPAYGGAQIALAHACREAGKRAVIFVAKRNELHARTKEAQGAGADIMEIPYGYLSNVQSKARLYCQQTGAHLLPFGFDTPEASKAIADTARSIGDVFDEVWCVAGSGVLARALQASGIGIKYFTVSVGGDADVGIATNIKHPLKFEQNARIKPPFPSCSNYDAKVWEYVRGRTGKILLWNVM